MRSKSPSPERKEELPTISKPSATALENLAKIRAMYGGQTKMTTSTSVPVRKDTTQEDTILLGFRK